jgi:type II secretory pathway pseudopilin PulG
MRTGSSPRGAFTLVELLVAAALIVFMMAVLSHVLVSATKSFRDLKAAGDLTERLRSVSGQLRSDLNADHFEGKKRLSDPTFWDGGPPRQGFFRVYHGTRSRGTGSPAANVREGRDQDGLWSYRSTDHQLHFTVKRRGNQEGEFFTAGVPAGSPLLSPSLGLPEARFQSDSAYRWQWAEVAWFLRPAVNSEGVPDTANGTPLYSLHRRQRLAVPDNTLVTPRQPSSAAGSYLELSCGSDPLDRNLLYFNNPADLTAPGRRFGTGLDGLPVVTLPGGGLSYPVLAEQTAEADLRGADLALTDVISFDVRLLLAADGVYAGASDPANPFVDLYDTSVAVYDNGNPVLWRANGPRAFDTWSGAASTVAGLDYSAWGTAGGLKSIPMWKASPADRRPRGPITRALQITIRVWDVKTSLTRQVTIVQAM